MPSRSIRCPMNLTLSLQNSHLSELRVTPAASSLFITVHRRASCSAWLAPYTNMSSIWQSTPSSPPWIIFIRCWNSSGALEILKGSLLKQYLPKGVMKVVSGHDSLAWGICQNPLFASSFENTFAPVTWANVSSTIGMGWGSRNTLLLSCFRSTQIRTAPECFGTTTIPAHQGVGLGGQRGEEAYFRENTVKYFRRSWRNEISLTSANYGISFSNTTLFVYLFVPPSLLTRFISWNTFYI